MDKSIVMHDHYTYRDFINTADKLEQLLLFLESFTQDFQFIVIYRKHCDIITSNEILIV